METILRIFQVFLAVGLIGVVLLQRSEGGGLGIGSSGGAGSFMSVRGSANFLTRVTAIFGGLFMVICLAMAMLAKPSQVQRSIFDTPASAPAIPAVQTPATPEPAPAPEAKDMQAPAAPAPAAPAPTIETPPAEAPKAAAPAPQPTPVAPNKSGTAAPKKPQQTGGQQTGGQQMGGQQTGGTPRGQ